MADKAIECWETAIDLDPERHDSLVSLVDACQARERDGDDERVFKALQALEALGRVPGHHYNTLGIAYYNRKQHQRAIRCYKNYAIYDDGPIGYYNLALAYNSPEVRQPADAVDALRKAIARDPSYEKAQQMLGRVVPGQVALAARVWQRHEESALAQDQWYSNYVNPYELLQLAEDGEVQEADAKAIQKAKKILLQEIELEEGVVSWVPGLRIDRSRALRLVEEIVQSDTATFHQTVAEWPHLNLFLSRGQIDLFMVNEKFDTANKIFDLLHDFPDFAAWASPIFAAQFNLVFSKALEARGADLVELLSSGRRFVLSQDEEYCFEGAQRQVKRLLEPLEAAAKAAKSTPPTVAAVRAALAKGGLDKILAVLPQALQSMQLDAASMIRSISIAANNDHGDADLAKEILQVGRAFAGRSPSLQHQMNEDAKALDELIKQRSEDEAHVTQKGVNFSITRKGATFGPKHIAAADVRSARWGMVYKRLGDSLGIDFSIVLRSVTETLTLSWTSYTDLEEQKRLFRNLSNAVMTYLMPTILERMDKDMDDGRSVQVGEAVVNAQGVTFTIKGWFSDKTEVCPWRRVKVELENGDVILTDATNSKAKITLPAAQVDNAFPLFFLAKSRGQK
jgi:tetratricopeptide (TPR) repeat protein